MPTHDAAVASPGSTLPSPSGSGTGIEEIVLALEEQARRSRDLSNDARDARRAQQRRALADERRSAKRSLGSTLVQSAAEVLTSALRAKGRSDAPGEGSGGGEAASGSHEGRGGSSVGSAVSAAAGRLVGAGLDFASRRSEQRGKAHSHAAEVLRDVAADAETARDDAKAMQRRAREHLEAIERARIDAMAAIVRG